MEDITPQEVVRALRELQNQVDRLENQLQERTGENTTLRERVNQLQNELQNQINGNAQLQEQIRLLGQQAEASASHISNLTTQNPTDGDASSKTKIAKPDLYYGDRKKLQTFISQLELYFFFNPHEFPNEERKVMFAATYLRSTAAQWFDPYLRDRLERSPGQQRAETIETFGSFNVFLTRIKRNFGDLDEKKKATRVVMSIQQKTSVTNYTTEFQQAAALLEGWSERALMEHYYRGLKEEVKNGLLVSEEPSDLNSLILMATRIDNRLFERRTEQRQYNPFRQTPRHPGNGGDAMELDNINRKERNAQRTAGKRSRGPNPNWTEEQKKRYEQKLCIHCGKDDHMGWKCPNKKQDNRKQISATEKNGHADLPWTACYDNNCSDHYTSKNATGWFPRDPRKSKN